MLPATVIGQDISATMQIDLNKAEQQEDRCRISFQFHNIMGHNVQDMVIDVAILDQQGIVQKFLMLQTGKLTQGKRRLQQYDLAHTQCGDISEILVNDISTCDISVLDKTLFTPDACLDALKVRSRDKIKLGL